MNRKIFDYETNFGKSKAFNIITHYCALHFLNYKNKILITKNNTFIKLFLLVFCDLILKLETICPAYFNDMGINYNFTSPI